MLKYLLLLLPFMAQAQLVLDEATQTAFEDTVCQCFEEVETPTQAAILDCFVQNLGMVEEQLAEHIDPESELSEYEQGEIMGEQFFYDLQDDLIWKCDAYFQFFNQLRETSMVNMRKEDTGDIEALNAQVTELNNSQAYLQRAKHYFLQGQLDQAEQDYTQAVALNPLNIQAKYFLAWTMERAGRVDEALELYGEIVATTGMQEIAMIAELAKRKAAEQKD